MARRDQERERRAAQCGCSDQGGEARDEREQHAAAHENERQPAVQRHDRDQRERERAGHTLAALQWARWFREQSVDTVEFVLHAWNVFDS